MMKKALKLKKVLKDLKITVSFKQTKDLPEMTTCFTAALF